MGSSVSKQETKVFTPSAPIDYSTSFLSQLETSTESDYSRAQYTEKYIQDRVAAELTKLESEAIKKFQDSTNSSLQQEETGGLSVALANEKIQSLSKVLEENAKLSKVEVSETLKTKRQDVIQCLKDNKGKPLNCWEEVEQFKALVRDL